MLPSWERVKLPAVRSIMYPSSNSSYGPLIKRSLKVGGSNNMFLCPQSSDIGKYSPVKHQTGAHIFADKSDVLLRSICAVILSLNHKVSVMLWVVRTKDFN